MLKAHQPGHPNLKLDVRSNKGRRKRVQNRTTRIVKEAALLAVEASKHGRMQGLVEYLTWIADEYPVAFCRCFLSRLLPLQVKVNADAGARPESVEDLRRRMRERGIPIDKAFRLFEIPELPGDRQPDQPPQRRQLVN